MVLQDAGLERLTPLVVPRRRLGPVFVRQKVRLVRQSQEVTVQLGPNTRQFKAQNLLYHHALPNFYFHTTTAYNILRHNGVEIGKRDFLGSA